MARSRSRVSGLRTRFSPKSRVGQGLVSLAPWMDGLMLILLFVLIEGKFVLTPGVVVGLPDVPIRSGVQQGISAVVLSIESVTAEGREEIAFIDDEPFRMGDAEDLERLSVLLAALAKAQEESTLLLYADARVAHGSIVRLCDIARAQGISRVNVATRGTVEDTRGW